MDGPDLPPDAAEPAADEGEPARRLVHRVGERDPAALSELITLHGRAMTAVAYVVLQNRAAAETAAAAAIADCWRIPPSDGWPRSPADLRDALLAATAREALAAHPDVREVDPVARARAAELLTLDPAQRAIVALQVLAGMEEAVALEALRLPERRGRQALAGLPLTDSATAGRRTAVEANVAGLPMGLEVRAVLRAIETPPAREPAAWRRVLPPATGLAILLLVVTGLAVLPEPAPGAESEHGATGSSGGPGDAAPADQPGDAAPADQPGDAAPADQPVAAVPGSTARVPALLDQPDLTDCGLDPPGAPVAFAGWTTRELLGMGRTSEAPSRPVYVMVAEGDVQWHPASGARLHPPVVGRLACVTDPTAGTLTVIGLPAAWEPPEVVDGCPASPLGQVAGYREIGGPEAFVLLPLLGTSWWADDPSVRILARLGPSPIRGETVTAWVQPLGPGAPAEVTVVSRPPPAGRPRSSASYVWLEDVVFASPGCWVVSVALEGRVVGSAVLPVTARTASAAGPVTN